MRSVVSVSFPRSGHHLLERCLRGVFPGEVHYCDFYRHCRRSPCIDARTNLQKTHDFNLRLTRAPGYLYVVQFRHPLEAIVSWYEAELRHRHKSRIGEPPLRRAVKLTFVNDSEVYWRFFLAKYLRFWRKFVHKWAVDPQPGTILLAYPALVLHPQEELTRIAEAVATGDRPTADRIRSVVEAQHIAARRSIRGFRYFDEERFARLEDGLAGDLAALGLPRVVRVGAGQHG